MMDNSFLNQECMDFCSFFILQFEQKHHTCPLLVYVDVFLPGILSPPESLNSDLVLCTVLEDMPQNSLVSFSTSLLIQDCFHIIYYLISLSGHFSKAFLFYVSPHQTVQFLHAL
jgi:hypothetical protein